MQQCTLDFQSLLTYASLLCRTLPRCATWRAARAAWTTCSTGAAHGELALRLVPCNTGANILHLHWTHVQYSLIVHLTCPASPQRGRRLLLLCRPGAHLARGLLQGGAGLAHAGAALTAISKHQPCMRLHGQSAEGLTPPAAMVCLLLSPVWRCFSSAVRADPL